MSFGAWTQITLHRVSDSPIQRCLLTGSWYGAATEFITLARRLLMRRQALNCLRCSFLEFRTVHHSKTHSLTFLLQMPSLRSCHQFLWQVLRSIAVCSLRTCSNTTRVWNRS